MLATVLKIYLDTEFAPLSGYIVIGGCFFWSFVMVGLLAADLAFTLSNEASNDLQKQERHNQIYDVLWQVVYWSNFLFGTVLKKVFQKYWMQGHFTTSDKVKATLKSFLIQLIAAVVFGTILVGLLYYYFGDSIVSTA